MTRYITAAVIVERLIGGNSSLFVQGARLSLLMTQLSACDRETAILERKIKYLEAQNQRLRLQIQQRDLEIYRLRALA
jgi:hypothetical protein